jgi:hypothetical protein
VFVLFDVLAHRHQHEISVAPMGLLAIGVFVLLQYYRSYEAFSFGYEYQ